MESGSNKAVVAVVALVAGVLVGGASGYAIANNMGDDNDSNAGSNNSSMVKTTDTKAADLRVALNVLEREHVSLASQATRAGFDGDASFDAKAAQLDENSVEISQAVGSVYGPEAEAKFLEIWRSHITFFVNYTVAAKAGDEAGMTKAVEDLNGYVAAIADFFSGANENLPREAVAQLITEHVGLLKATVDAHGAGDHALSQDKEHETNVQVSTVADTLAGAIVKQNPDKF